MSGSGNPKKYSSIQMTKNGQASLKKKRKPGESYEQMMRRRGWI